MDSGQVQVLICPIAVQLYLLLVIKPGQLGGCGRQEVLQGIQIRESGKELNGIVSRYRNDRNICSLPFRRSTEQFSVQFLQLTQALLIQVQFVATKVVLLPFCVDDFRMEPIDFLVLVLMAIQFRFHGRQIRSKVGGQEFFLHSNNKYG